MLRPSVPCGKCRWDENKCAIWRIDIECAMWWDENKCATIVMSVLCGMDKCVDNVECYADKDAEGVLCHVGFGWRDLQQTISKGRGWDLNPRPTPFISMGIHSLI